MNYEIAGDAIEVKRPVLKGETHVAVIRFRAEQVRKQSSGVHARVYIINDSTILAWNLFNVERDEDRTRLANSAFARFKGELPNAFPKANLKHEFDLFCRGLWDASLSMGEQVKSQ